MSKGVPGVSACYRRIQQPHVVKLYLPPGWSYHEPQQNNNKLIKLSLPIILTDIVIVMYALICTFLFLLIIFVKTSCIQRIRLYQLGIQVGSTLYSETALNVSIPPQLHVATVNDEYCTCVWTDLFSMRTESISTNRLSSAPRIKFSCVLSLSDLSL